MRQTIQTCESWLENASAERRALVEHALRSAVKRGAPDALRLLGYGQRAAVAIENVRIAPRRVRIGGWCPLTEANGEIASAWISPL